MKTQPLKIEDWEKEDTLLIKLSREMAENRAKIIDDFVKTYIASRWEDYFLKQKKIDFRRVELVERRDSPVETTYFCRLKKGKLKGRGLSKVKNIWRK